MAANQHKSKVAVCPLLKSARPPNHPARHRPSSSRRAPLRTLRYHSHVYRATPLLLWPGLLIMCMEHGVMRHVWWGVHTLVVAAVTDKTVAATRCHRHSCRRRHRPAPRGWGRGDCRLLPPPSHRRTFPARHQLAHHHHQRPTL